MSDTNGLGPQPTAAGRMSGAGGLRTAGRRPARGGAKTEDANNSMKIYMSTDGDGSGLKVGPVAVLVMSLAYMVIVVFLHMMAKFKMAMVG